jgi:hypothetical protein
MTLEHVKKFQVSREIVTQTESSLQDAGYEGYELFVLWSGEKSDDEFFVRNAHVPPQTSYQTEHGLLVRVDGPALHDLNVWLYQNEEMLGVQVHAHPTHAFHSETDDTYPIMTTVGGLSIVAADFARDGLVNRKMAAYRLSGTGWTELKRPHKSPLIEIVS